MTKSLPNYIKDSLILLISILIVVGWLIGAGISVDKSLDFLGSTYWSLQAPPGSPSEEASRVFKKHFKSKGEEQRFPMSIIITCLEGLPCGNGDITTDKNVDMLIQNVQTNFMDSCHSGSWCVYRELLTYQTYLYDNSMEDSLKNLYLKEYLSTDRRTTRIQLVLNNGFGIDTMYSYFDDVTTYTDSWVKMQGEGNYKVGVVNENMMLRDAKDETIHDFEFGDSIALTIAWSILFYAVGPAASVIFLTLPCSLLVAFGILDLLAQDYVFAQFDPSIFLSLLLAMTNDFALFLLTRYKEELREVDDNTRAVTIMMKTSGRVVLLSGVILGASFGGLTMITFPLLQGIGIGGAVTIFSSVLCHLTMLPAFLLVVGRFKKLRTLMVYGLCSSSSCCKRNTKTSQIDASLGDEEIATNLGDESNEPLIQSKYSLLEDAESKSTESFWIRLGLFCHKYRILIVTSTIIILIPAFLLSISMRPTTDQSLLLPGVSQTVHAVRQMQSAGFSTGILAPYFIAVVAQPCSTSSDSDCDQVFLPCNDNDKDFSQHAREYNIPVSSCHEAVTKYQALDPCHRASYQGHKNAIKTVMSTYCPGSCPNYCPSNRSATIMNSKLFDAVHDFKKKLIARNVNIKGGLTSSSFTDFTSFVDGTDISKETALDCLIPGRNADVYNSTLGSIYRTNYQKSASWDGTAAVIQTIPEGGSFDGGGEDVTRSVRDIASLPEFSSYGFNIVSDVSELLDGLDQVYAQTPRMMVTTIVVVVFCLSLLAFKSLLLSVRLLLTICVTLFWVFASTILIFQGIFGQTGIYWVVPIACGPVVCGLALDYDTLLISRIYEYRHEGYSTLASVLKGLDKTGGTITTAGIIMMVAFSAMMFSSEMVLVQFGFTLVSASFIDTFFVRTIFVPSIFFIGVEYNWWPGKVPAITKSSKWDSKSI